MSPKEILDTILGYLGFAVQIEEQPGEHGLVLQIYTSDADLLTARSHFETQHTSIIHII